MQEKCPKCGGTEFTSSRNCKHCRVEYLRQYREKNKEKASKNSKKYYSENKEKIKTKAKNWAIENAERRANARHEYYLKNKENLSIYYKEWREKNFIPAPLKPRKTAEELKETEKAYRIKNREKLIICCHNYRAKKRERGSLSKDIKDKLLVLQKWKCACCKSDLRTIKIHMDHIIPLSLGGMNIDNNIQLLCWLCNQQKYTKHPVDFMQSKGYLL